MNDKIKIGIKIDESFRKLVLGGQWIQESLSDLKPAHSRYYIFNMFELFFVFLIWSQ